MPAKAKRAVRHVKASYKRRGLSDKEAERRAYATVNKHRIGGGTSHKKHHRKGGRKQ